MEKLLKQNYRSFIGDLTLTASGTKLVSIEFKKTQRAESNRILVQAKKELDLYFAGKLKQFKVPLHLDGTEFQKKCWHELLNISYGQTISYKEQAIKVGGGANYARAVAGANNKNVLPIIIPCHRVIGSNNSLVGYAGGLGIKKALLNLEEKN
ncbi:MAG: methylated-DNA--[protein]-cysteine S-methyltransferase [Halobacteriovoraceae bacterium]|nr:methylated-DNA--[protein]-cysteine S-methyltransferase [Halobacteriovoraceae bacterium]